MKLVLSGTLPPRNSPLQVVYTSSTHTVNLGLLLCLALLPFLQLLPSVLDFHTQDP